MTSENKEQGYVSIYRSIKTHWIWNDPLKLKWWLDILLSVNYSDVIQKVNINFELFECGRGQSVKTLNTWSKEWQVGKDTVRNFFKLLQKDNMISLENLQKCTRITVCNYDSYQVLLHDKQSIGKRKPNASQTQADPNNKDNKVNKDNNSSFISFSDFETKVKEKITNEKLIIAFTKYFEMRIAKKKQMTAYAVDLQINKLKKWFDKKIPVADIVESIDNSTVALWTDIYEPKKD